VFRLPQGKGETIKNAKFKHAPVEKGCVTCHSPHASPNATALLKSEAPELCKGCHDTNKPFFIKQHANMPVANSQCTQCHKRARIEQGRSHLRQRP